MDTDFNYCLSQWENFITLTEEEKINLAKLTNTKIYMPYKNCKYRIIETGITYDNIHDAAKALNVSSAAIYTSFRKKNGYLPKIKVTLERI